MLEMIDTKQIFIEWDYGRAQIRKPKLQEACDLINELCHEVCRLKKEVEQQKKRQDIKEQTYDTMMVEIQNVVMKYTKAT